MRELIVLFRGVAMFESVKNAYLNGYEYSVDSNPFSIDTPHYQSWEDGRAAKKYDAWLDDGMSGNY